MKRGISKRKRGILIWLSRITAILIAVCMTLLFAGSYITINTQTSQYHYLLPQYQRNQVPFEDSELFSDLFNDSINNITRTCVIKNQLETNEKYNGKKIIDITSYANRTDVLIDDRVTAEYYLDDLIKWGNYGFDFKTISGTPKELDQYYENLYKKKQSDNTDFDESNYLSPGDKDFTDNTVVEDGAIEVDTFNILIPRYTSTEGKDLIEYAKNREEYGKLVDNLKVAAQNLFQNYTEYVKYNKIYSDGNTNIRYCYQMIDGNKVIRYNNLHEDLDDFSDDNITALFNKYRKFISYNPAKMQISTNANINAEQMRNIIASYEYSFPDNSRVWIAIDDSYQYNDVFKTAYNEYSHMNPNYYVYLIILFIAIAIHLLSIIILTIYEGRSQNFEENKIILKKGDKIPLEIFILLILIIIYASYYGIYGIYERFVLTSFKGYAPCIVFGISSFVLNLVYLSFYLCTVRKIKDRHFFRNSIIYSLGKKIKEGFLETYDNGQLVTRTWLPYLLFLSLNLVLVLIGTLGIIIAFLFDIIVGTFIYKDNKSRQKILDGIENIRDGDFNYQIQTDNLHGDNLMLANSVNSIGKGIRKAVETSMKDERLKADLITNVSHDIKTPLTSIINYVDLIKREQIENSKIKGYVDVLDAKSQRLKQLTDDLVEASKISSGNITLNFEKINFVELVNQSLGEFSEKFEEKQLQFVVHLPDQPVYILADSRRIFRVIENLYNNIYKYAMERTRVYVDMTETDTDQREVILSIKNISAQPLNIKAEELTERFIRGDVSRGTEGSGLGLSIAKNLTQALNGEFNILLDGDLFKVILIFKETE